MIGPGQRLERRDALDLIERAPWLPCLIWSGERQAYWRENGAGYTADRDQAGRYTIAAAVRETLHCDAEKRIFYEPADYARISIFLPPSTNALFVEAAGRNKGGGRQRVKTKAYKAWIKGTALQIQMQLIAQGGRPDPAAPLFAENFGLWIRLNVNHNSDITNRIKALEDLLVSAGVTTGDQWNDRTLIERDRTIGADCIAVIYREVPSQ